MSLPSSEPLPNDINDLPPARQRHIRRQPQSASIAERQILVDSLLHLTAPSFEFFLLSLLGASAAGAAIYFDEPLLFIIALVLLPFHRPAFGLALFPVAFNFGHGVKTLLSLLILYTLVFAAGAAAGLFRHFASLPRVNFYRFSALYWLDAVVLGFSALFCALILFRQGRLPRLAGVLLSYNLLIPICAAGFGLTIGQHQLWPGALILGIANLGIAILIAAFGFLVIGFAPRNLPGWLMILILLGITGAAVAGSLKLSSFQLPTIFPSTPTPTTFPTNTPLPATSTREPAFTETATVSPTITPSITPTITVTATQTQTPEPTSYFAIVDTVIGAVIRESPAFNAAVVGYTNDGDEIEILTEITPEGSSRWYQVRLPSGEIGWLLGSLVNTQTPIP